MILLGLTGSKGFLGGPRRSWESFIADGSGAVKAPDLESVVPTLLEGRPPPNSSEPVQFLWTY